MQHLHELYVKIILEKCSQNKPNLWKTLITTVMNYCITLLTLLRAFFVNNLSSEMLRHITCSFASFERTQRLTWHVSSSKKPSAWKWNFSTKYIFTQKRVHAQQKNCTNTTHPKKTSIIITIRISFYYFTLHKNVIKKHFNIKNPKLRLDNEVFFFFF